MYCPKCMTDVACADGYPCTYCGTILHALPTVDDDVETIVYEVVISWIGKDENGNTSVLASKNFYAGMAQREAATGGNPVTGGTAEHARSAESDTLTIK